MGFKDYKELLMNNLEFYIDNISIRVGKIRKKTVQIKAGTKQRALDFFNKLLSRPETQIEVTEAQREYADAVKLLEEDIQYIRKLDDNHYTIGSLALRDLTRGVRCPGRAAAYMPHYIDN